MNENKIDRKIAVIFVTDVVGFSKLMEKNEDQTLKSFRSCREILEDKDLFIEWFLKSYRVALDKKIGKKVEY